MVFNGNTEIYGIMGDPVSHSLSPAMHNAAFKALGMNRVYVPFPVKDVEAALQGFRSLDIKGVSITIPYKETVIPFLDEIDPVAQKIGAVNTLQIINNHICGYNTDWLGAINALKDLTPLKGKKVLLLGAGGSARAIGFGLLEELAMPVIASRPAPAKSDTASNGQKLAEILNCQWIPLVKAGQVQADILINATSLGMAPNLNSPMPKTDLSRFPIVMDIVYAPLATTLLRQAEESGCQTINGLAMLLRQGAAQFELWTGEPAPLEVMGKPLAARFVSDS